MKFRFRFSLVFLVLVALAAAGACSKSEPSQHNPIFNPGDSGSESAIPDKEGMNVKGKIVDDQGKVLEGIVVSDGIQCVKTDKDGLYYMKSDFTASKCVFPIAPSEYEVLFDRNKMFSGYKPLSATTKVNECSFTLKRRSGNADNYTMLFLGDPQVVSSRPHSGESWKYVTKKLNEYGKTVNGDLYQILMGDMVVNEIEDEGRASSFLNTLYGARINTFTVIGNHDHVQSAKKYYDSVGEYYNYFGPYNFAVNIGKLHYIFVDDVDWKDGSGSQNLTDDGYKFMKADLAHVDKDVPVMICTHIPITRKAGGSFPSTSAKHYWEMMNLLVGRDVIFWYGHTHFNIFWSYSSSQISTYAPGLKSLESHVVGRCGGCWACSGEVCRDGSPRGVVQLDVKGKQIQWRYISIDENYPSDFNVICPGQYKDNWDSADLDKLFCNIYVWDEKWSTPELWVNGQKAGTMTRRIRGKYSSAPDPLYSHFYPIWSSQKITGFRSEPAEDYDNNHLFEIVPPAGVRKAEIRFKDRWGNEYKREVSW